jgi:hypothetical protein
VVYWQPPKQALDKVKELVYEPSISRYGSDEGIPELREALVKKVIANALTYSEVWSLTFVIRQLTHLLLSRSCVMKIICTNRR